MIIVHFVDDIWQGRPICGAEFPDGETTSPEAVTCEVCLKLLENERQESEH